MELATHMVDVLDSNLDYNLLPLTVIVYQRAAQVNPNNIIILLYNALSTL